MFGWLFNKKKSPAPVAAPQTPSAPTAPAAQTALAKKSAKPAVAPAPAVDWSARLAQASGNDEALLALARTAGVPLATKQAAVEALSGEAALKAAELEFRGHDRRVHQLAKRRLQAAVSQRQNREQAERLIATARSLLDEADVPVNRRVDLDQAWQALDANLLEPTQRETFKTLATQLTEQARQAADAAQQRKRWQADATQALAQLRTACSEAADGVRERSALADPVEVARRVLDALPMAPAGKAQPVDATPSELRQALDTAAVLDEHLAVLDRLLAAPPAPRSRELAETAAAAVQPDGRAAPPDAPAAGADAQASGTRHALAETRALEATQTPDPRRADGASLPDTHEASSALGGPGFPPINAADRLASADAAPLAEPTAAEPLELVQPALDQASSPTAATRTVDAASMPSAEADDPQRAWQALTPIGDARLAAALQARHARWQQARDQARQERQAQRREAVREQGAERQRSRTQDVGALLADSLAQTEAALDAGQLADAHRHLTRIDAVLDGGEGPEAHRARIAAAQARLAQLRGWQHWAGSRAREELVAQAEALAAATLGSLPVVKAKRDRVQDGQGQEQDAHNVASSTGAGDTAESTPSSADASSDALASAQATHSVAGVTGSDDLTLGATDEESAGAADDSPARTAGELDAEVARLSIRQRTELIDTLRARWKDIDRAGGGGGRALWPRFDTALKAAYEPVAAHVAAQRAARESNLSARRQLLDTLETVGAPMTAPIQAPVTSPEGHALAQADQGADAEPLPFTQPHADPRALASALDRFNVEWRKLGPLEHTVPREARAALVRRLEAAVRRVETPLQAARERARAQREALVVRARTLAGEAQARGRDFTNDVRALQGEWQQHAKALPLSRADEQALWTDFKAAIDSGFAAREAVFNARDAEFEAYAAERVALIERLQVRPDETPGAQRRLLAEVEAAWQRCGPAPRARAAALDADFRAARDTLRQWLDDSAQRAWNATCDALDAKLALCGVHEQQGAEGIAAEAVAARTAAWQALPALPAALEEALRRRIEQAPAPASAPTGDAPAAVDDLLLQIETAWDLPTPPAFEALRRERKLLALKEALEGRRPATASALTPDGALAELLGRSGLDPVQRERLGAVLTAWRQRGPQRGS